jgi:phage portal protein BeeE
MWQHLAQILIIQIEMNQLKMKQELKQELQYELQQEYLYGKVLWLVNDKKHMETDISKNLNRFTPKTNEAESDMAELFNIENE